MNKFKSHIMFTKQQRYGIFLLLLIIVILQYVYLFWDHTSEEISLPSDELEGFQQKIDSLKLIELEGAKPKLFPFNPNYITDFKGYSLGMTNEEIDLLHAYRAQNKWVNSAKDFQQVTGVSDSLLQQISPFFKFPEWVNQKSNVVKSSSKSSNRTLTFNEKTDLNTATAAQLQTVYGIGKTRSLGIIKFRNSFDGGFIADVQLEDVYGLTPEVIENIKSKFTVKTPRTVIKVDLNTANANDLVKIQHIDYPLAKEILDYRTLHEGFTDLDELLKVKGFPSQKLDIIKLYLAIN
ncbi:ComEA family DNA-binding protein [Formosa algae]|uniref:DNA uptake protein ComE-like DNA-binding protein n=2 Tax=Formosa algae TaxID=225843 RepID=A0A9X0YMB7_9FLAO|nr:helix-hairpin-helix domain-containing protein [Formosa algae]MBP1839543.1 DNA uptake protein ComE-like DNA-binding protein [Formosa algae]MDQ0334847.1 DNA uptake protein ComE-like DNA-binding protein [Formosa algae]OEI82089.1 competence protein ComEA [Formosa algae]